MLRTARVRLAVATLLSFALACSDASGPAPTLATIAGDWRLVEDLVVEIEGDDVEDAGVAIDGLSIAADGHYTTRQGEAVYSQGTVEMRGDSLIFTALPEQERTRDAWRLEHGDLVLTRRTSRDFASTPGVVVVPAEQVLRFERD